MHFVLKVVPVEPQQFRTGLALCRRATTRRSLANFALERKRVCLSQLKKGEIVGGSRRLHQALQIKGTTYQTVLD